MARTVIAKVLNNTRSKILGGVAVYQTGFDNDLGLITIAPASYESRSTMPAIGIVREDIEPNGEGVVTKTGLVGNINTSATSVNASVFVGSGGSITFTDPNDTNFDFYSQQLGTVTRVDDDEGLIDLFPLEVRPKIKHDEILEVREEQHHDPVTAKNIGGGAQVFKQIDRQAMTFRTIVAGEKIAITSFSDRIEIADNQLVDYIGQNAEPGQVAYWFDSDTITGESAFYWDTDSGTLRIDDYIALRESTAPSLTSGYGKLFVKSSDSRLYFLDEDGDEFDLLAAGTGVPDTTFQDNKTFWNEAIYHLTIAADAYSASAGSATPDLTFQQNKTFWNEAIYHLRVAADGYAGGGGTVTATQGADGYLAFFTSANAIAGDNDLFWDRVNEGLRLGASNLTVGGTVNARMKILRSDGRPGLVIEGDTNLQADMALKAPNNAADEKIVQILVDTNGTFGIRAVNDTFTTVTNNLFIGDLGTGDVAIGTTITTGARVHVYRNANFGGLGGSSLLLENPNASGSGDSGVIFRNPAIDWFVGADRSDSSKLRLTPEDEPEFSSLGITITTAGDVGIGTRTPAKTLHVFKGSAGTIAATTNASVVVENSTSSYIHMFTPNANESGILFGAPDMSIRTAIISPASSDLQFRSGGNVTRMTLASNGNLGIGTLTPHATLTVNGHIALEETAVSPPAQDGYGYLYVKTDDKLYFRSGPGTEYDLTAIGGGSGLSETTFQENKTFWNESIYHLNVAADGYVTNQTFQDNKTFWNESIYHLNTAADGYVPNQTFQENKTFWNEAVYHLNTAADGYVVNQTFQENKTFWNEAVYQLRVAADGYSLDYTDITSEPTGFPNRTDSNISFEDVNRRFAIEPSGASFSYYIKGTQYTISSPTTVDIADTEGLHYIYFNGLTLSSTTTFSESLLKDFAFVSTIYWDATNNVHVYFGDERHGLVMDWATHIHLHLSLGAQYISGLGLADFSVDGDGSANIHAQFSVANGEIRDEDISHTITDGSPQDISPTAQIPVFYRSGASGEWRRKNADSFPLIYSGTAGYTGANGRVPYNEYTGSTWQLTEISGGNFILVHVLATNDTENPIVAIHGQEEFTTIKDARAAANTFSVAGLPFVEFVPIAAVIFQSRSTFTNTPKAIIVSTDIGANYVDLRTSSFSVTGETFSHSHLSDLDFDSSNHSGFQRQTFIASVAPKESDDGYGSGETGLNFEIGSFWTNRYTEELYVCKDNALNTARWEKVVASGDLDGYVPAITFEENKLAQEEINRHIIVALDGYGAALEGLTPGGGGGTGNVTSAQGSDGYVAFFTTPDQIAGDNDLFWDRERNQLGIGTSTPNEKLTVNGAISLEEQATDPEEEAGFGKLWVRSDGKLFFIKEDGVQYDLTAFTGDVDGGNFLDILSFIPAVDGGDF